MGTNQLLSIFTPTRNRPEYIYIICEYLKNISFEGKFIVIDGSHAKDTEVSKYNFVEYYWEKDITMAGAFVLAGKVCNTKYMMYLGDDDFILPDGSSKIIERLEQVNEERCGFGNSLWVNHPDISSNERPVGLSKQMKRVLLTHKLHIQLDELEGDKESKIVEMINNYRVYQFTIIPNGLWKRIYSENYKLLEDVHVEELASSLAVCLETKQFKVEEFYMMRGTGHSRPNSQAGHEWHKFPNLNKHKDNLITYAKGLGYKDSLSQSFMSAIIALRLLGYTNHFIKKINISDEQRDKLSKDRLKRLSDKKLLKALDKLIKIR